MTAGETLPTVLIVDDEADILVALEDLLGDDFRLLTTTSPARALEMLADEPDVAVIVSDQRMPEMPGHVFLSRARALSSAEALLLTGYADIDAVISAVNEGRIGGYAHKPWDPDALRQMVAAAADRTRLKRQLAFEQALFAALVARTPDRIGVLDDAGQVLRGDAALADGAKADRLALEEGTLGDEEVETVDADGRRIFHRVRRVPLTVDGKSYLLKIVSDETERRMLQQRLQQSEKLQALGTLAGGIAHDFNNLLTAINGNLELAAGRVRDDRIARYLEHAAEAARRGAGLTKRLLSFGRQGEMTIQPTDPNAIVRGMRELILRTTDLADMELDLVAEAWPVCADPEQLELAILNLAINARDAMGERGRLRIATANRTVGETGEDLAPGDYGTIEVADTGAGMAPEIAARVFEPFFTTKERGRGTGLGLPMVRAMAVNAGGRVQLRTAPGQGTTITIWLPRSRTAPAAQVAPEEEPHCAPLRVLLAEDDAAVRAVSEACLRELGHQVVAVASGTAALALFEGDDAFDLVMTDFAMPGMSGAEIAESFAERRPDLPVLVVSGFAEIASLPATVSTLRKPFSRAALAQALHARFGAAAKEKPAAG